MSKQFKIIMIILISLAIGAIIFSACVPSIDGTTAGGLSNANKAVNYVENEYLLFKYDDLNTGYICYIATTPNSASALELECFKK